MHISHSFGKCVTRLSCTQSSHFKGLLLFDLIRSCYLFDPQPELNPASLPSLVGHQKGVVMLFHQLDNQSKQAESELAKVAMKRQFESTPITWIDR